MIQFNRTSISEAELVRSLRRRLAGYWLILFFGVVLSFLAVSLPAVTVKTAPLVGLVVMLPFVILANKLRPQFLQRSQSALRAALVFCAAAIVCLVSAFYLSRETHRYVWVSVVAGVFVWLIVSELRIFYSPQRFLEHPKSTRNA
jgi:hypothetical protein